MKTKIKYILLLSVVIIISVACNVNAATPYFTGRKSEHPKKQEYLNGITEEMCTSSYWKDKNFIEINKQLMTSAQIPSRDLYIKGQNVR